MFLPMLKLLSTVKTSTLFTVFPINHYNQQIYLNGAHSGFEPESPVHIRT
jgi:hypothetical protein